MIEYIFSLIIITAIFSLLVQSYNLSFGLGGMFNLGHIVFYGVGAYAAAILNTKFGFGFFENLIFGALVAGTFAVAFGLLTLRLSGHYLCIATLGAAMITGIVATNWMSLTNGPLGIRGIEEPSLFGNVIGADSWQFLVLTLVVVGVCQFLLYKLFHSPFGRLLRAIQYDEVAAKAIGKDTFGAKTWSLILSAMFAGMAGVIFAHYRLFLDPSIFALSDIILIVMIVVIGGRGNFWGAILGTIFITFFVSEIPRFVGFPDSYAGAARNILYAAILVATMFLRPHGLFTFFEKKK